MRKLLALLLAPVALAGQQQPSRNPGQATPRIEATDPASSHDIHLDVYPTLDGKIVAGLTRDEFEVVEEGTAQTLDSVTYIGNDGGARLVVAFFVDTYHVNADELRELLPAVARQFEPVIDPDARVAVVTPDVFSADFALAQRPARLERMLLEAASRLKAGPQAFSQDEKAYLACFEDAVATELIARRRQKIALDTLQDLIAYLRAAGPMRKAVVIVGDGWNLFRAAPRRLPSKEGRRGNITLNECERDRALLGQIDHADLFQTILGEANHAGVAFYPLKPRRPDQATLRVLGEATDGVVIDLSDAASVKRVADDLSAYYVIAYRSTNTAPDGKLRRVRVRVKRPGLEVRARPGYRPPLPTKERAESGSSARSSPLPADLERAFQELEGIRRDARIHVRAAPVPPSGADGSVSAWVAAELDPTAAKSPEWSNGGEVEIALLTSAGTTLASTRVPIEPRARTILTRVTIPVASEFDGTARVRAIARPASGGQTAAGTARVAWPDEPDASPPLLLFRRGPITAQQLEPAADIRFRRSEQVRIQVAVGGGELQSSGRVINRAGQERQVPVTVTSQRENDVFWVVAELALAPLTAGDYAVELLLGQQKLVVPLQVVP